MGNQYAYMFMLRCYHIDENRHMKEKKVSDINFNCLFAALILLFSTFLPQSRLPAAEDRLTSSPLRTVPCSSAFDVFCYSIYKGKHY